MYRSRADSVEDISPISRDNNLGPPILSHMVNTRLDGWAVYRWDDAQGLLREASTPPIIRDDSTIIPHLKAGKLSTLILLRPSPQV